MFRFARPVLAALLGLASVAGATPSVRAADLGAYSDDSGVCAEGWVLSRIRGNFSYQVSHVPNLPQVAISDFQNIQETRYLPALGEERPIGRRYCGATVVLSDGDSRDIWYLIEEGQGFASIGNNVEFCVSGFDRWYVYNGRCRVLR